MIENELGELSEREIVTIQRMRKASELRAARHRWQNHILETTREYHIFLWDTGCGTSYSTFCDNFGYENYGGITRKVSYDCVLRLLNELWNYEDGER